MDEEQKEQKDLVVFSGELPSAEPFEIIIKFKDGSDMSIPDVVDFGFPGEGFNVLFVNKGNHNILFNMDTIAYVGRTSDFGIE
ncbi:MAG: hypothetical protein LUD72_02915 [Bacteroidales bacterium]|nr:hypothetical protein [Bacteroidales bacterium]